MCKATTIAGRRAGIALGWADDFLDRRDPIFAKLNVASAYAAAETPFLQCETGFPHGAGIGSEATARMGYRFMGSEIADFVERHGNNEAKAIVKAGAERAVAMVRLIGESDGKDIFYEVLGTSGRKVASVCMKRNLSARVDGDDLHIAYALDLSFDFENGAPAAEKFLASYAVSRVASAHLDNDLSQIVYDLEDASQPAFMSFCVLGTSQLGSAVEHDLTDFVASMLSDFHDWFRPETGKEDLLKPYEALTDLQGFIEEPDDWPVPAAV